MYLTKYLSLCQLIWSKVLEHKISTQLLKYDMFFECCHCLVEQTFFLLAAIFAFYMLKTYYSISFELVLQILGGLFPQKINLSDAKLTLKV